ncbi:helix-turn-helix domain-containing protein [Methylobacterium sp. WSM2598]|uniref:helix-turn-helix domain-containing protein n=1 Tax=Methylobacterium sp. WSM2598 TaxID=398261 RepID=UPI0009FBEEEE
MNSQPVQVPQGDLRASTPKLAFTVDQACYALGLGRTTVYELLATGRIKGIKIGNRRLILADGLRTFLANIEEDP